ncbi:hypothetical protein EUGRSUZ_A01556 [Eucalyptus grandis]|uniref:Uncharacterized protein n=2 Tax=Eucalyptus grandis TaxID=71139 RepID=A0ACC3M300_EUCGR|nr:hypothetical protein EUGRSUZ_A01556 [Eucalyptus grandis]
MATFGPCFAAVLSVVSFLLVASAVPLNVSYDERGIKLNGQSRIIISGSIHYPRSTPEMWGDLIKKAKEGGLNAIETYVFWNAHEPLYRQYDFEGNKDLVRGFPVWLHNLPGVELRTNNTVYQNEMKTFVTLVVDMMQKHGLFAIQGGPIIVAQIENEYGNVEWAYGNNGKSYINWCAQLAESYGIQVPWIMCQQSDAPSPMINTCNGWYCDQFSPNNPKSPKWWAENWSGWFKDWGMKDPHRTAEDLAFAVARFFQYGGSLQNYYMLFYSLGGTNFDRTAGGPYITTSYDYDAPLDEYGNLNKPKWGHLKRLHELIMSMEEILTRGVKRDVGTVYMYEGKQSCFLGNANQNQDFTVNLMGSNYTVLAWSVSILPNCYTEVYNTAKTVMVKLPNEADDQMEPYELKWDWRPEQPESLHQGIAKGSVMTANELLDQKTCRFEQECLTGKAITLQVHTNGHIIHAFVNGKHVGSQWGTGDHLEFIMEKDIKLKHGKTNSISLLSVTVGLQYCEANFDTVNVGIHGPVKLIGNKGQSDEVGLNGMEEKVLQLDNAHHQHGWKSYNLPSNRLFEWYKTTFKAPMGSDPVVDLQGLGKGTAWVNGHNIGRFWPSYVASEDGCTTTCDYRGAYNSDKCLTNCRKPSQR